MGCSITFYMGMNGVSMCGAVLRLFREEGEGSVEFEWNGMAGIVTPSFTTLDRLRSRVVLAS